MKRRLFWKILLGFWLTTIVVTQLVWLAFSLLRPLTDADDRPDLGPTTIAQASAAIRAGGASGLLDAMNSWPGYMRRQIVVRPAAPDAKPSKNTAIAQAPDGRAYRVTFRDDRRRDEHEFFDIPWQVLLASVVGGLAFSFLLASYVTNPIRRMARAFGSVAQGDFAARLGPAMGTRRDEIADLAHDFDTMAQRLDELVKARDRLLADVSHELRSPLARLQLAIALARQDPAKLDNSLGRIDREAAKLDELVGELLTLSKLESGVEPFEQYFDLAEIVKLVAEDARFEATPAGVDVTVEINPPQDRGEWICRGNGKLIQRAVENIVRNAVRFSKSGQQVRICLMPRDEKTADKSFELTVMDQGPGVPAALLDRLFLPFVKGSGEGGGFGLGLAIAQRAIVAHGGQLSARNRSTGGLQVSAILPAQREIERAL